MPFPRSPQCRPSDLSAARPTVTGVSDTATLAGRGSEPRPAGQPGTNGSEFHCNAKPGAHTVSWGQCFDDYQTTRSLRAGLGTSGTIGDDSNRFSCCSATVIATVTFQHE
eukprot:768759-Hanusia_phi.AAC.27